LSLSNIILFHLINVHAKPRIIKTIPKHLPAIEHAGKFGNDGCRFDGNVLLFTELNANDQALTLNSGY
jgi:hypothetical protein